MIACRVDSNHTEVISAFRKLGCSVLPIHTLKNCGDAIVAKNMRTAIIEIKDGKKPPSQRKLTKGESEFAKKWLGLYVVIMDLEDVINLVRALEKS